jgi:hypothetical protein
MQDQPHDTASSSESVAVEVLDIFCRCNILPSLLAEIFYQFDNRHLSLSFPGICIQMRLCCVMATLAVLRFNLH